MPQDGQSPPTDGIIYPCCSNIPLHTIVTTYLTRHPIALVCILIFRPLFIIVHLLTRILRHLPILGIPIHGITLALRWGIRRNSRRRGGRRVHPLQV